MQCLWLRNQPSAGACAWGLLADLQILFSCLGFSVWKWSWYRAPSGKKGNNLPKSERGFGCSSLSVAVMNQTAGWPRIVLRVSGLSVVVAWVESLQGVSPLLLGPSASRWAVLQFSGACISITVVAIPWWAFSSALPKLLFWHIDRSSHLMEMIFMFPTHFRSLTYPFLLRGNGHALSTSCMCSITD